MPILFPVQWAGDAGTDSMGSDAVAASSSVRVGGGALPKPTFKALVGALWVANGVVVVSLVWAGLGAHSGQDFQWWGSRMLLQGRDPFRLVLTGSRPTLSQFPNYLHLLYVILLPLGAIPFAIARVVWLGVNLLLLASATVFIAKKIGLVGWPLWGFVGLLPCSQPFVNAVLNGQQTALVLAASVLSFALAGRYVSGVALAIALVKYSFAPIAIPHIFRRRFGLTFVSAMVLLAGLLTFSVLARVTPWSSFVEPVMVSKVMAQGAGDAMTLLSLGGFGSRSFYAFALGFSFAIVLCIVGRHWLRASGWLGSLACASLISLMSFPHLIYDYCFLLPVLGVAVRLTGWRRIGILVPVALIWYVSWVPSALLVLSTFTGTAGTLLATLIAFGSLVSVQPTVSAGEGSQGVWGSLPDQGTVVRSAEP